MSLTPIVHDHSPAYVALRDAARRARVNGNQRRLYLTTNEAASIAEFNRAESWLWEHTIAMGLTIDVDDVKALTQRESWT